MPLQNQQSNTPSQQPVEPPVQNPEQPVQKIGLVWIFLGIGAILLMWFVSYKVF